MWLTLLQRFETLPEQVVGFGRDVQAPRLSVALPHPAARLGFRQDQGIEPERHAQISRPAPQVVTAGPRLEAVVQHHMQAQCQGAFGKLTHQYIHPHNAGAKHFLGWIWAVELHHLFIAVQT